MPRRVSIFGSTGSIGQNTVDLLLRDLDCFEVVALTGGANVELLAEQARELGAEIAVTAYEDRLSDLRDALDGSGIDTAAGTMAVRDAADRPADWVMSAIVGAAGLYPGFAALRHGSTLALANKESLVTAGPLLMAEAAAHNATILPVDSEHSAVFQALVGEDIACVERVVITASGGPFRDWTAKQMARATPEQAVAHPNWSMGQRISIDSASMFNKALELIETKEFFGLESQRIEAVVHPESLIHAIVGYRDGGMMAHLGAPDMRHAIGYALNWPERKSLPVERLDLTRVGTLRFEAPDEELFPALRLARDVMDIGGRAGTVLNAAKEVALDAFIARQIGFSAMARVVEEALEAVDKNNSLSIPLQSLDCVANVDHVARQEAAEAVMRFKQQ